MGPRSYPYLFLALLLVSGCGESVSTVTSPPAVSSVPAIIPIPAVVWLFVSGLFGLLAIARRRPAAIRNALSA